MTAEREAELIAKAVKEVGLDTHIRWIDTHKQAGKTWAERIMERFRDRRRLPVKNSYMFCDTLDMCFAYTPNGTPVMTYAGCASAGCVDITEGKLAEAFCKADIILRAMKRLAEEEV